MQAWSELDNLQALVETMLREVDGGSVEAMNASGEAAEIESTQQAVSAWTASKNVVMSSIALHKLNKDTPEYAAKVQEIAKNKSVVNNAVSNGAAFVKSEMGQAGADAKAAGGQFFTYLKNKFTMLMNWLPGAIKTVFNAVSAALRAAFNFVKGFFTAKDGKWAYLKSTNIFGFPASSWVIWGAVSAFVIIALTKVVKWLKNRKRTEGVQPTEDNIVLFDESMLLKEGEILTESMQGYVYSNAATASTELDNETAGAEKGSTFWKVVRKIAILLLIIFGIAALAQHFGSAAASTDAITSATPEQLAAMDKLDTARLGNAMRQNALAVAKSDKQFGAFETLHERS